jgi:hypothetical protein
MVAYLGESEILRIPMFTLSTQHPPEAQTMRTSNSSAVTLFKMTLLIRQRNNSLKRAGDTLPSSHNRGSEFAISESCSRRGGGKLISLFACFVKSSYPARALSIFCRLSSHCASSVAATRRLRASTASNLSCAFLASNSVRAITCCQCRLKHQDG